MHMLQKWPQNGDFRKERLLWKTIFKSMGKNIASTSNDLVCTLCIYQGKKIKMHLKTSNIFLTLEDTQHYTHLKNKTKTALKK